MKPIARALPALILAALLLGSIAHTLEAEIRLRFDGSQTPSVIGVTNIPDETNCWSACEGGNVSALSDAGQKPKKIVERHGPNE